MTGAELSKELTKHGREIAGYQVFIDKEGNHISIGEVVIDEECKSICIVPENKAQYRAKKRGRGGYKLPVK